jgi:long-chain acyl-CoA synthetase
MRGYKDQPGDTKKALGDDGWLHTGDIGFADEEGHLFLSDRA